jgi:predicted esterase
MDATIEFVSRVTKCTVVAAWMALASCVLVGEARAEDSDRLKTYRVNWEKAQQAFADKDYGLAADYYRKVAEVLPFEPTCRYQLACCLSLLGDRDKAMTALEAAVNYGWDDSKRLEQAGELKELRSDARFAQIIRDSNTCAGETTLFYAGKRVKATETVPLIVLLPGLGYGPRADVSYWKQTVDQLDLVLVAARGPTKFGPMLYGWHRPGAKDTPGGNYYDMAAAGKRIAEAIAQAEERFIVDKKRIVLAGFSQGGGVALQELGDHPERYCGGIVICSRYQPPGAPYWKSVVERNPVRVFALAGKLDSLLPRTQEAVRQFREAQLSHQYEEMEREGHEYPLDYSERLIRGTEFVLGTDKPRR